MCPTSKLHSLNLQRPATIQVRAHRSLVKNETYEVPLYLIFIRHINASRHRGSRRLTHLSEEVDDWPRGVFGIWFRFCDTYLDWQRAKHFLEVRMLKKSRI